jgi:hypothetical protein
VVTEPLKPVRLRDVTVSVYGSLTSAFTGAVISVRKKYKSIWECQCFSELQCQCNIFFSKHRCQCNHRSTECRRQCHRRFGEHRRSVITVPVNVSSVSSASVFSVLTLTLCIPSKAQDSLSFMTLRRPCSLASHLSFGLIRIDRTDFPLKTKYS